MKTASWFRNLTARMFVMALVFALVLPMAQAAQASVAEEPAEGSEQPVRVLSESLPVAEGTVGSGDTRQLWVWPDGRRGYQLAIEEVPLCALHCRTAGQPMVCLSGGQPSVEQQKPGDPCAYGGNEASTTGALAVVAYDLDTNTEVNRQVIEPRLTVSSSIEYGGGHSSLGAIDPASGRLFLPYASVNSGDTITSPDKAALVAAQTVPRGEEVCPFGAQPTECVAGIVVVDGTSLDTVRRIPLRFVSVEGAPTRPALRSMDFAPSRGPGDKEKVLLVVEETLNQPLTGQNSPGAKGFNVLYLVQMDIDSGQQDWVVRLDACRYTRDSGGENASETRGRPNAAAVIRDIAPEGSSVWVACHSGTAQAGVVRVPLDAQGRPSVLPVQAQPPGGEEIVSGGSVDPDGVQPASVAGTTAGQEVFPGPTGAIELLADPPSGRFLMRVLAGEPKAEVWWVFDTVRRNYVGTIGIGQLTPGSRPSSSGIDRERGRLYVFVPPYANVVGGLYVADIRRAPLPQATSFPHLAHLADWDLNGPASMDHNVQMAVDPGAEGRLARVYWRHGNHVKWTIIEDGVPVSVDNAEQEFGGRTLDLEEAEGVTTSAWDGAAQGYGARLLLVGGVEGAGRAGPADVGVHQEVGPRSPIIFSSNENQRRQTAPVHPVAQLVVDPCGEADRELVLASVGGGNPAVVDVSGGRGSARPLAVDSTLAADLEAPVSRCAPLSYEEAWAAGLFGTAPAAEPGVPSAMLFGKNEASCLSSDQESQDRTGGGLLTSSALGDPVGSPFAARVECSADDVSGWSQARVAQLGDLAVSSAYANFRLYRDPARGIVSRVESVARGVGLQGAFRIDSVRTVAESWANGRKQPVADEDREAGYDYNCDMERSAGSCFRRHLAGVWTPHYSCGPCGDEARLEAALTRAMGANGAVRLRQPDPELAKGAANGFIAAVAKPDHERFADLVLNNDLLQTVVPGLEIVRYAYPGVRVSTTGGRARQIYQFAGVEVSSSYGISCNLVYDEATNTCAEPAEAPGSIQVTLSDTDGKPLAGGAFEVREDVDADGVLGLKDTLLPDGACVTAEDGIGTCMFDNLAPGTYLVSQVAAPPGYAKSAEPWVSEVVSGEQRTVAFTNVSNVSTIDLTATDENGAPLSGAVFAAYPDPDSDGKVAPDAQPAGECTTDAQGACQMKVPAGSYVLVQTSAPGGLEGIEPVPFTFASGGQVASVTVVNYPPAAPEQPAPAAAPIDYSPPLDYAPPVESVSDFTPVADTPVIEEPAVSVPERIGGTVTQVIRAPGDALRLLARDPMQAAAWIASLALFALAVLAVRRRHTAAGLSHPSDLLG